MFEGAAPPSKVYVTFDVLTVIHQVVQVNNWSGYHAMQTCMYKADVHRKLNPHYNLHLTLQLDEHNHTSIIIFQVCAS